MSYHNKPKYNTPDLVAALKAHNLKVDTPDILADAFRLGWVAAMKNVEETK